MLNKVTYATITLKLCGGEVQVDVVRRGEVKPIVSGLYNERSERQIRMVWEMVEDFIPVGECVKVHRDGLTETWERTKDPMAGGLHFIQTLN